MSYVARVDWRTVPTYSYASPLQCLLSTVYKYCVHHGELRNSANGLPRILPPCHLMLKKVSNSEADPGQFTDLRRTLAEQSPFLSKA